VRDAVGMDPTKWRIYKSHTHAQSWLCLAPYSLAHNAAGIAYVSLPSWRAALDHALFNIAWVARTSSE
jgi:hypothetical protein